MKLIFNVILISCAFAAVSTSKVISASNEVESTSNEINSTTIEGDVTTIEGKSKSVIDDITNRKENKSSEFVELKIFPEELGIEILREHSLVRGGRIVYGSLAATNQFPWFGYVVLYRSDYTTFCGSALISSGWVITAAHCMHIVVGAQVYFGSVDKQNTKTSRSASRYIVHADYQKPTPLANDVALIQLTSAVAFSTSVKAIQLPSRLMVNKNYYNLILTASGFGQTASGYPRYLQYTYLYGITGEVCLANHWVFRPTMLCGKSATGYGSSTCFGDSGGPLIFDNAGTPILVGVTSFVQTTQCYNDVQGFTRVDSYLDWISSYTGIYISW